jgi:glycoside/pentoside/hexuronide:cation symporter, GPH family
VDGGARGRGDGAGLHDARRLEHDGAMIAYAAITNILLMTLYSMNNMPYSALGGVMTGDVNERAKLNSFRFIAVSTPRNSSWADSRCRWWRSSLGLIVDPDKSNVPSVGFGLFTMFSQVVTVAGVLCSAYLSRRFGKKSVAITGFSVTTIFMMMFIFLPRDAVGSLFLLEFLRALSYAPTIPLIWAMFADVVDYGEWRTGRRTTGVIYATILFGLKAGLSLGGAIAGWLLSGYGYQPNVVQSASALQGIRMTISVYPAIFFGIVILCLTRYKISKKLNLQIQDELAERRQKFAT